MMKLSQKFLRRVSRRGSTSSSPLAFIVPSVERDDATATAVNGIPNPVASAIQNVLKSNSSIRAAENAMTNEGEATTTTMLSSSISSFGQHNVHSFPSSITDISSASSSSRIRSGQAQEEGDSTAKKEGGVDASDGRDVMGEQQSTASHAGTTTKFTGGSGSDGTRRTSSTKDVKKKKDDNNINDGDDRIERFVRWSNSDDDVLKPHHHNHSVDAVAALGNNDEKRAIVRRFLEKCDGISKAAREASGSQRSARRLALRAFWNNEVYSVCLLPSMDVRTLSFICVQARKDASLLFPPSVCGRLLRVIEREKQTASCKDVLVVLEVIFRSVLLGKEQVTTSVNSTGPGDLFDNSQKYDEQLALQVARFATERIQFFFTKHREHPLGSPEDAAIGLQILAEIRRSGTPTRGLGTEPLTRFLLSYYVEEGVGCRVTSTVDVCLHLAFSKNIFTAKKRKHLALELLRKLKTADDRFVNSFHLLRVLRMVEVIGCDSGKAWDFLIRKCVQLFGGVETDRQRAFIVRVITEECRFSTVKKRSETGTEALMESWKGGSTTSSQEAEESSKNANWKRRRDGVFTVVSYPSQEVLDGMLVALQGRPSLYFTFEQWMRSR